MAAFPVQPLLSRLLLGMEQRQQTWSGSGWKPDCPVTLEVGHVISGHSGCQGGINESLHYDMAVRNHSAVIILPVKSVISQPVTGRLIRLSHQLHDLTKIKGIDFLWA